LTQEFFARLLAKQVLGQVDRRKGRFRSFLLASIKHFIANEWDRSMAAKRGGGAQHIRMDDPDAEASYSLETASQLTPDKLLDRRWALVVLDRAMTRLREDFAKAGKTALFDRLKILLTGEKADASYAELAAASGITEASVKVTVHRMRQRCRELVRLEIARTVIAPEEIDDELAHLLAALKG
jgi:RNA polymerase sigma-70 factor (ECF subfamily)